MRRLTAWGLVLLAVNAAYPAAFADATVFYMANALLHLALGLALMVPAVQLARRYPRECGAFLLSGAAGIYLAVGGNTLQHRWAKSLHVLLTLRAVALLK